MIAVPKIHKPEAIVVAGGGSKSMAALGTLHVMKKAGHLEKIKTVAGTSAGAIVAASLALNRDPIQMAKKITEKSYSPDFDIKNFGNSFGLDSGRNLFQWIDIVLDNETYTFRSIYDKTGISLIVCATNLSTSSPVYFSHVDHPDMDVRLAIRMSCSIPIYFSAVRFEDEVYVDGALSDPFPIDHVMKSSNNVLGIRYDSKEYETPMKVDGLDDFFRALIATTTKDRYSSDANVFTIDVGDLSVLDFQSPKKLKKAFKIGHDAMANFLKKND